MDHAWQPGEPVLEARALTKRYGGFRAVREVSFSIRPGELLGLVGPNGAGKSTIVKMLTGLAEPTSGSVLFHGQPISRDLGAYKRNLGYVPETPDLYGFLTGWEYLEMVATLRAQQRLALEAGEADLGITFESAPLPDVVRLNILSGG